MRTYTPVLNGKGLLAAAVAILSGNAAAEVAGRVSFVSGDVTVTGSDGASRVLARGAAINGGDRISTRAGRAQIRFTDGGFVSLQPNTVFGVDEYLYSNRKPEESSLFFSLIQGGMRTITGAIGKVNKKSYQVRTPVATIGIRGTEYLANVSEAGLVVSVGKGFVNVANSNGDVTAGAGQNIIVRSLQGQPGLGKEEADIKAAGVDGDQAEGTDSAEDGTNDGTDTTVRVADVLSTKGDYLYLFTTPGSLPDSDLLTGKPQYLLESTFLLTYPVDYRDPTVSFYGAFDQTGAQTNSIGTLLGLYTVSGTTATPYFQTEGLQAVDVGTVQSLSWGAFTNGLTTTNEVFDACNDNCTGTITLAQDQFLPYIVGVAPAGNLGKGTAVYSLQGGTHPRDQYGTAGSLDAFVMKLNLDFATVSAMFKVTMPSTSFAAAALPTTPPPVTYTVKTKGDIALLNLGTALRFTLDASMLDVTDSDGACAGSSGSNCSASINAFFAGPLSMQMGTSYQIEDYSSFRNIRGVAALGLAAYDGTQRLPDGPGYTLAYSLPGTVSLEGGTTAYDPATFTYTEGLTVNFNVDGHLGSATLPDGNGGTLDVMRRMAAPATDLGKVGALKWGRWYNNDLANGTMVVAGGSTVTLNGNDSLPYVLGPATHPAIFTAIAQTYGYGATAKYTFQGGTAAVGSDGVKGHVVAGSHILVTFSGVPQLAYDIGIDMNAGNDYQLRSIDFSPISATVAATGTTFYANSGNGSCSVVGGSGGCMADIKGFFAGQQAQQIGMSYSITDFGGSRTVNGAGAFGRGKITPNTLSPAGL